MTNTNRPAALSLFRLMVNHQIQPSYALAYRRRGKICKADCHLMGAQEFIDWLQSTVLAGGFVSEEDFNLLRVCDETDAVVETVQKWYIKQEIVGRKAIVR